jgi:8-oxo-dGTP pyrophosphatase MutT (NUDIX family)
MNNRSTYQFCNNCGKQGHLFNQCKNPIISSGIVAFRKKQNTNDMEYLMICRKDSLGYIDFLRVKYPLYDKKYILSLINEMTIKEKDNLLTKTFNDLWKELWGDFVGLQYRGEEKSANDKFCQMHRGIQISDSENYDLTSLINDSVTNWKTPEWGFPKGRRNYQENDTICGLREFEEETGYDKEHVCIVKNILPFEEIFVGSNFKSYKHIYFLGYMKNKQLPIQSFQKSEVSKMSWFTLEECIQVIRVYNLEKIAMIIKIDKLLKKYRLIS